jgi:cephalosporin-C deacetylase-like acetyl esterase
MPRIACALLLAGVANIAIVSQAQQPAPNPGYVLRVRAEQPDAVYKVGEEAKFLITFTKDDKPAPLNDLSYVMSLDGYKPITGGKLTVGPEGASLTGKLDAPGFLQVRVTCKPEEGKAAATALAAAGFDPLEIKPSMPVPDDFDAFWAEQKKQLAAVPPTAKLTAIDTGSPEIEVFDLKVDCLGGRPVSGVFARPKNAKPKTAPAVLYVHGAGVRSAVLASAASEAKRGRIGLDINAHGILNSQPQGYYDELNNGELKGYRTDGRESRETCYFRGMFLRLVRAIDFLCAQPEWDGKIVIVRGGSQGGGQALAAAGLDPRVTAIWAGVPALCDHTGSAAGRVSGWPKIVPLVDGKPDPKVIEASRYFDGMNFATRTKADAIVTVGFIDQTCPPSAVYATYNNLPGNKKIVTGVLSGHEGPPGAGKPVDDFLSDHIRRKQAEK